VIHCVITARDCVMVEARRVSLAFLDEVEYFRKRAARWCEPPVQYRFVREDLVDAEKCRVGAAMPLAKHMRDTRRRLMAFETTKEEATTDAAKDASALAKTLARLTNSARVLLDGDPTAYALDLETRAWLKREVEECSNTSHSLHPSSLGSVALRDAFAADERATHLKALVDLMSLEGARGAHRIGAGGARRRRRGTRRRRRRRRGAGVRGGARARTAEVGTRARHRRGNRRRPQSHARGDQGGRAGRMAPETQGADERGCLVTSESRKSAKGLS
jgi:hypothetical protein